MDVEEWFAGPYKVIWHEVWEAGRAACEGGVPRDQNPQTLKVWRAVWWYGWDNYDPNPPEQFKAMEEKLANLPMHPFSEADL